MTNYTHAGLEAAKAELAAWNKRFDDCIGNNPDKYQADIKSVAVAQSWGNAVAKKAALDAQDSALGLQRSQQCRAMGR